MLSIGHIELFVLNVERSREFYERVLGFEVVSLQPNVAWLKCGQLEILLRKTMRRADAGSYAQASVGIVLYTDDLPATMEQLKSRGLAFRGHDGAECCPTFTDLDGHWFQLVDPKER